MGRLYLRGGKMAGQSATSAVVPDPRKGSSTIAGDRVGAGAIARGAPADCSIVEAASPIRCATVTAAIPRLSPERPAERGVLLRCTRSKDLPSGALSDARSWDFATCAL